MSPFAVTLVLAFAAPPLPDASPAEAPAQPAADPVADRQCFGEQDKNVAWTLQPMSWGAYGETFVLLFDHTRYERRSELASPPYGLQEEPYARICTASEARLMGLRPYGVVTTHPNLVGLGEQDGRCVLGWRVRGEDLPALYTVAADGLSALPDGARAPVVERALNTLRTPQGWDMPEPVVEVGAGGQEFVLEDIDGGVRVTAEKIAASVTFRGAGIESHVKAR